MTPSGTDQALSAQSTDGRVSFASDGSHYYVTARKDSGDENSIPHEKPDTPDIPQTGDNSKLWLWWLMLTASAGGITSIWMKQRRGSAVPKAF